MELLYHWVGTTVPTHHVVFWYRLFFFQLKTHRADPLGVLSHVVAGYGDAVGVGHHLGLLEIDVAVSAEDGVDVVHLADELLVGDAAVEGLEPAEVGEDEDEVAVFFLLQFFGNRLGARHGVVVGDAGAVLARNESFEHGSHADEMERIGSIPLGLLMSSSAVYAVSYQPSASV